MASDYSEEMVVVEWRGIQVKLSRKNVFKVAGEVWAGLAAVEQGAMSHREVAN